MDTKTLHSKSGQAMVEFCIGLIAILTVVAGTIQLGRMGLARMEARVDATGTVSALSMNSGSTSIRLVRNYIQENTEGLDGRTYSMDDTSTIGNAAEVYDQLLRNNHPQLLHRYAPNNTLASIQNSIDLMGETALVSSTSYEYDIPVMPIIRKLIFNQETVDLEVSSWTIRTGDLY
ncbi:pilus assembly protein [Kiritimatiellota bacterium B12222]|nr:pilus assembly protein [Kiritimatiellota bacterium B12222]